MQHTVIALVLAIIIIGGGGYLLIQNKETSHTDEQNHMEEGGSYEDVMEKKDGDAMMEASAADVTFDLTGKNFSFSEKEIRVKKGQKVTVNFTSESGFHDWIVDEFNAATDRVNSGGSSSVTFVADQEGEFEYYCSVGSHRALGMVGTLIVE